MCRGVSLATPQSVIEARFGVRAREPLAPRYNIAPGDRLAIIPASAPTELTWATWGFIPAWMTDLGDWTFPPSCRADSVTSNPAFRPAFAEHRCLVIADGFYVWEGSPRDSQPYRVERIDSEPFALAGLYQPTTSNGREGLTVAILTTAANALVGRIDHRMPVVLEPNEEARWLSDAEQSALESLLDSYPADLLASYPVSTAVNHPETDHAGLIEPIEIGYRSVLRK